MGRGRRRLTGRGAAGGGLPACLDGRYGTPCSGSKIAVVVSARPDAITLYGEELQDATALEDPNVEINRALLETTETDQDGRSRISAPTAGLQTAIFVSNKDQHVPCVFSLSKLPVIENRIEVTIPSPTVNCRLTLLDGPFCQLFREFGGIDTEWRLRYFPTREPERSQTVAMDPQWRTFDLRLGAHRGPWAFRLVFPEATYGSKEYALRVMARSDEKAYSSFEYQISLEKERALSLGDVSGTVSIGGQPLAEQQLTLQPITEGRGSIPTRTGRAGTFTLKEIPCGVYVLRVGAFTSAPVKVRPYSQAELGTIELTR